MIDNRPKVFELKNKIRSIIKIGAINNVSIKDLKDLVEIIDDLQDDNIRMNNLLDKKASQDVLEVQVITTIKRL